MERNTGAVRSRLIKLGLFENGIGRKNLIPLAHARSDVSTREQTLGLFKLGMNVSEISAKRVLAESTIISHIEKLFMDDKISKKEIEKIIPARTREARVEIEREFKKNGDGKLAPVFEKFKGRYSYEDLRMVRMISQ